MIVLLLLFITLPNYNCKKGESFGCKCGLDENNDDNSAYKRAEVSGGTRLVGGEDLKNPSPWFVFIMTKLPNQHLNYKCGGTLLNQQWIITAAHCFCTDRSEQFKGREYYLCSRGKKGKSKRLIPKVQKHTTVYFGISAKDANNMDASKTYTRKISKVVIHENYDQHAKDDKYNDIALVRLKDPIKEKDWLKASSQKRSIGPICLPERDTRDKMVTAFIIGFGTQWQYSCHTGGNGWQMYTPCAPGATWKDDQGKNREMKVWEWDRGMKKIVQCSMDTPPIDEACMEFNMAGKFEEKVNITHEVILVPKDRKKKPYSCFSRHSLVDKNRGHDVQLENDQVHGWCGTCDLHAKENEPGFCGKTKTHSKKNYQKASQNFGWGYCTKDCAWRRAYGQSRHMQIADQILIPHNDCGKMLKGIKSTRKLKKSQLCAGWKIPEDGTKPKIYEYRTKGKDKKGFVIYDFKEIKSTSIHKNKKDWDRYEDKKIKGLNYLIGGKDTCQGDSGGPIYTRQKVKVKGKTKSIAYLEGITSMGGATSHSTCGMLNHPGIYTRVKSYLKWIKRHVKDGKCGKAKKKKSSKKCKSKCKKCVKKCKSNCNKKYKKKSKKIKKKKSKCRKNCTKKCKK